MDGLELSVNFLFKEIWSNDSNMDNIENIWEFSVSELDYLSAWNDFTATQSNSQRKKVNQSLGINQSRFRWQC